MLYETFQDNIVKSFLYTDFSYGLPFWPADLDYCLTVGVTCEQEMCTRPRHFIPPMVYPGVRVCYAHLFVLVY